MRTDLVILLVITFSIAVPAQKQFELTLGAGYTAVDVEGLVEEDEVEGTIADDWGQFCFSGGGQFCYLLNEKIGLGGEVMYQNKFWYSVRIPYGSQTIYREYSVNAFKITPILRFIINNRLSFDTGPEFNFSGGLYMGLLLSAHYLIPINNRIAIPVAVRIDLTKGIVTMVPISLTTGIRITM